VQQRRPRAGQTADLGCHVHLDVEDLRMLALQGAQPQPVHEQGGQATLGHLLPELGQLRLHVEGTDEDT